MLRRVALLALVAGALWLARHRLLGLAGGVLVAEDPLAPADVVVVSNASLKGAAVEAARLYASGIGRRIVVAPWVADPIDAALRARGVTIPDPAALARDILERSGVRSDAIVILPETVDGTNQEIAAVARFAAVEHPRDVLFLTARSHTARSRVLLRRALASTTRVAVRSVPNDPFDPNAWWRDRRQVRDVGVEYLRWINSVLLGDRWSRTAAAESHGK